MKKGRNPIKARRQAEKEDKNSGRRTEAQIDQLKSQESTTEVIYFFRTIGEYGCLSQWWSCEFSCHYDHFQYLGPDDHDLIEKIKVLDETLEFNCAEQYMMFAKALFFGDFETAGKIMKNNNPRQQKGLGRNVNGFDEERWEKIRSTVVENASVEKFGQNKYARQVLLSTDDKELVEASPFDRTWGIGFTVENAKFTDRGKWGLNLLGKALVVARTRLRG
jgi:ribA/ribD-fused uncharacterized protein